MAKRKQPLRARRARRRPRQSVNTTLGSLRVHGEEQFFTSQSAGSTPQTIKAFPFYLRPGKSGMPMLDKYAELFDRYRIESLTLTYHPGVGTTVGGTNVVGVDFDPRTAPVKMEDVLACVPKMVGAVWQQRTLTVPQHQLMSRKLLYTYRDTESAREIEDTAALLVATVGDCVEPFYGRVVAKYTVYFEGPYKGN